MNEHKRVIMKYDFTTFLDRSGMDALAIDGVGQKGWGFNPQPPKEGFDFIPMWVADMNFATAPSVTEALARRVSHPIFGYFFPSDAYFESIIRWQSGFGHTGLTKKEIGYENGVHGFVSSCVQAFTQPGEKILLHEPVYVGYYHDVEGLGRTSVFSELIKDKDGIYRMDFEDMDRKIRENHIHLVIFCSPHNPTGRVWDREELEKAMEIFERNQCIVVSDEIWCDLIIGDKPHIPLQLVNDWAKTHVAAAYAPSKTFNLAGLIGSYHIIYDPWLRDRITAWSHSTHYNEINVLSMHALIGAYSGQGREWVNELNTVLRGNCRYACDFIHSHFPDVGVTLPEATYMLFLDCTEYCRKSGKSIDDVLKAGWDCGVGWQDGRKFNGPCHIRMNLALPERLVKEAFDRLQKYVFV